MEESKVWTVLYGLSRVMRWSWLLLIVGAFTWGFHVHVSDRPDGMPSWGGGLVVGFAVAAVVFLVVFIGRDVWREMEPSPPPEFIQGRARRKAAKDEDVAGGLSQANATGGEVSIAEGGGQ